MSKENVKKFLEKLVKDEALQNELIEEMVIFGKKAKFLFTAEELRNVLSETGAIQLSDEDLEKVAGGAYPTAVNDQITDSVT